MQKKISKLLIALFVCMFTLTIIAPVSAFAAASDTAMVSAPAVHNGTLSFKYDRGTEDVTRFDIYFYANNSSATAPSTGSEFAWVKANTGAGAADTSAGVDIALNLSTFSVNIDLKNLTPYSGTLSESVLSAPNTHFWCKIVPCDLMNAKGDEYNSFNYLGSYDSWSSATAINVSTPGSVIAGNDRQATLIFSSTAGGGYNTACRCCACQVHA